MSIPKQITFLEKSEYFLMEAIGEFCDPIISTLGPDGCTVIISDGVETPHVTKDGVTVSESIHFLDNKKQAIASLIKEAARKTASAVGDGTTTSVVLTKAMLLEGLDKLKSVKSKKDFFDGFDFAFEQVVDFLTDSSVAIAKNSELLESVVKISANGDEKICKLIMSAIKAAGIDGLVNVELNEDLTTSLDIKGGSSLESSTFITNGKRWEASGPGMELILVSDAIEKVFQIKPILTSLGASKVPAVIIAREFTEEVINTVMVNNTRNAVNIALVETEGFARSSRMEILEDLRDIFGVPIYSSDGSTGLQLHLDYLETHTVCPMLSKAIITPTETILFRTIEDLSPEAEARYLVLNREYEEAKSSSYGEGAMTDGSVVRHLQRRMSKYNAVATIKVGAATRAEAIESKDRIDDALSAVTAAVNGGIIQGGGMALFKAGVALETADKGKITEDYRKGYLLMARSCKAPFRTLAENAGESFLEGIPEELLEDNNVFDFRKFKVVNYLDGGIIDPALVPISAITNSSSVAKTILKSNSIITEWQEEEDE